MFGINVRHLGSLQALAREQVLFFLFGLFCYFNFLLLQGLSDVASQLELEIVVRCAKNLARSRAGSFSIASPSDLLAACQLARRDFQTAITPDQIDWKQVNQSILSIVFFFFSFEISFLKVASLLPDPRVPRVKNLFAITFDAA